MYPSIPLVLASLAFLTLFLLFWSIFSYAGKASQSRETAKKLQWAMAEGTEALSSESSLSGAAGSKNPVLRSLTFLGNWTVGIQSTAYSSSRINFLRAGLTGRNIPALFWGTKLLLAAACCITFIVTRVTVLHVFTPYMSVLVCLLFAMIGFYLPDLWLSTRISRRRERIARGLPDALDLMTVSVEAGMGLDTTINRVAQEIRLTNRYLGDELKLYNLELNAGKSRADALKNLAARTNHEDINSLVTLLIQADKFGTSVGQALRVYSDTFRSKRYLKAEEVAAKMPLKLIVVLILCIFPALFVVLLGPPVIRLLQQFNIIS